MIDLDKSLVGIAFGVYNYSGETTKKSCIPTQFSFNHSKRRKRKEEFFWYKRKKKSTNDLVLDSKEFCTIFIFYFSLEKAISVFVINSVTLKINNKILLFS